MKKRIFIFWILAVSFIFTAGTSSAEIIDKVLAVVNNEVITQSELDRILFPIYTQYSEIYSEEELPEKMDEARQEMILQMIEDKLIIQEAQKEGITVAGKEVDERIVEIKSKFPNEEEFEAALEGQGLNLDILEKRYEEQARMKKIFDKKVKSQIVIVPTEVQEYYKGHISEFEEPETVVLRVITLKVNQPEEKQKVFEKAQNIRKAFDEGKTFEEMAQKFSEDAYAIEGGLMGYVKKGQLMQEIDEKIFALKPGEFSDVIESDLSFRIFKVDEKILPHTSSFEQVREKIQNAIYQEKVKEKFDEWLDKLKKDAYISIK